MANDGGSESGTDEIQMNTECGNEAVNGVEQNERIEIQINIEGENEAMNGIEAGLEGQTGNEARNKPVNGLEGGLEGLTGIKPVNGGLNGSDGGHEAVNEIYGGLDGVNGVQEDECINLDDPLLGKWDAIQIPWEVFDNTQEPPCDNTQTEETSNGNAKKQGLQVNDHGVKISYGPPPKKRKKNVREESQPAVVFEKGTRKKKSLGLTSARSQVTRKYATRSRLKTKFHGNSKEPIEIG
nr:uncharacterized protein LOC109160617 [Ipomoea batatas]